MSSARNAGESAICPVRAQPSAEIARNPLRRARERQARGVLCSITITLVRGVAGELEDENWRLGSATLIRGVAGEWEDENWRLFSTALVRGVSGELEDENW